MSAYQTLSERWHRAARVEEAAGLLHWDQAVLMPKGGAEARADQMAVLSLLAHELTTQDDQEALFAEAGTESLDAWEARNLELMEKQWRKERLMPAELVTKLETANAAAEQAWGAARDAKDFSLVRQELATAFALIQERADRLAQGFGQDPYDMLMDDFEPGLTQARVDPIFAAYSAFLPDFLKAVQAKQAAESAPLPLVGPFDLAAQETLGRDLVALLGFDFDHGRLDVSRHPFCGGAPTDVRMTTRYDESDFAKALMGVLHETGHGLYEMGTPAAYRTQPVGAAAGLAMHESQSLLMEMQACRSDAFLSHLAPKAQAAFGGQGPAWSPQNMVRLSRRVAPGFIRVDADEVTYPAHVILRYELEKALFAGDLPIADLPSAFADAMDAHLGLRPPTDLEGVLQDIHWYSGGFGYFPTYSLGAMAAAQLFAAARAQIDAVGEGLMDQLARGDFAALLGWLRTNVHALGSKLTTDEILRSATGSTLDPSVFTAHLKSRYLGIADASLSNGGRT